MSRVGGEAPANLPRKRRPVRRPRKSERAAPPGATLTSKATTRAKAGCMAIRDCQDMSAREKLSELLMFAVSEECSELRSAIGVQVGTVT